MRGTRIKSVLRENLGNIYREIKIALTPVPSPEKWIFLVGCYNSGTTLLADLLSRHPSISGLPVEGHFITDQFVKDYEVGLPRMWSAREELFRLTEHDHHVDHVRIKKEWGMRLDLSKPVLLEKSPPNTVRTRWLNRHFSPAYFIAIIRNGYAVAEGISRKANPMHMRDGWPIEKSALQWKRSLDVLADDSRFLDNYLLVKYEDLVIGTNDVLNTITNFIGLDKMMDLDLNSNFTIHERNETIKNMNDDSIKRLTVEQIEAINCVAADSLKAYGYNIIDTRGR